MSIDRELMLVTRSSEIFGLPRPFWVWSAGVAAAVGVAYALAPTFVWFTLAIALLLARAVRGLTGRERRWVLGLLVAALALRLLFVAGLFLETDHYAQPFGAVFGDGRYAKDRSMWMRNVWLGKPIGPLYLSWMWDSYGWTGYHYLLAYLQVFLGPMPYGVHLLNIGFFLAAAVMLHRLTRQAFGQAPAAAALGAILFLPTLFLWSVSDIKEAFQLFLVATSLTALVAIWRTPGLRGRIGAFIILSAALGALQTVRSAALATFILGAGGGLVVCTVGMHWRRLLVVLACLTLIGVFVWRTPARAAALSERVVAQAKVLAMTHIGNVRTTGHGYKLLEQQFYYDYDDRGCALHMCEFTLGVFGRFVFRAIVAFVLVPTPWQMMSASELAVLPQQGVWYGLFALALLGMPIALRRNAVVAGLVGGYAVVGALGVSLVSGNVGTLVRHRDTVVPFILCFSAVGGCALLRWCLEHRTSFRETATP